MSIAPPSVPRPAAELVGLRIHETWEIRALLAAPDGTGGNFSVSYVAEDDRGNEVFVKALDFSKAFMADDPTTLIQLMTEAYNYERDLLLQCGERKLDRVVRVLAHGTVSSTNPPVPYLVFERADRGDIRSVLAAMDDLDLAFALRSLHHTAVGLRQLHLIDVAHQDLKPSNVVVFEKDGSKLADLGRSSTKERRAMHDGWPVAGDPAYSPPEQRYQYASLDWDRRRTATDLYHLGSMVMFLMAGAPMTASLMGKLAHEHQPYAWTEGYEAVLPYVLVAFDEVLVDARVAFPSALADDLVNLVQYLCHPDLSQRGHPSDRAGRGSNFSLERFVTIFDRLAYQAENGLMSLAS